MNWIYVKDKLPEDDREVLAIVAGNNSNEIVARFHHGGIYQTPLIRVASFDSGEWRLEGLDCYHCDMGCDDNLLVVWWQELPLKPVLPIQET